MSYVVYYWKEFSGRSQPILQLLKYAGVAYKVEDKEEGLKNNPHLFATPVLRDGDHVYSQTVAIMHYLGKKLNLAPANDTEGLMFALNFSDLWTESYEARKGADGGASFLKDRLPKWLGVLEAGIKGKYFTGDSVTYVDFLGLNLVDTLDFMYGKAALDQVHAKSKVGNWIKTLNALPSVVEFNKTAIPILYPEVQAK